MDTPKFNFSDVVVVEDNLVGVIVKSWGPNSKTGKYSHEVYVRSLNGIEEYREEEIRHIVYDKELSNAQLEYYE